MVLLIENNFRGSLSSVMGDRYVESDENKKDKLYGFFYFIWWLEVSTFTIRGN